MSTPNSAATRIAFGCTRSAGRLPALCVARDVLCSHNAAANWERAELWVQMNARSWPGDKNASIRGGIPSHFSDT